MGLEGFAGASSCTCVCEKEEAKGHKESTSFVPEREDANCVALCAGGWKDGMEWPRKEWLLESSCLGLNPGSTYSQLGSLEKYLYFSCAQVSHLNKEIK